MECLIMNKNLFYLLMTWDKLYQMSLGEYLNQNLQNLWLLIKEIVFQVNYFYIGKFISAIYVGVVRNLKIIELNYALSHIVEEL